MTENFYFCLDCLVARFSVAAKELCPVCSMPMTLSGWMRGLDQNKAEKALEGVSEPLAG